MAAWPQRLMATPFCTHAWTAEALGVAPESVSTLVGRARKRLKARFPPERS